MFKILKADVIVDNQIRVCYPENVTIHMHVVVQYDRCFMKLLRWLKRFLVTNQFRGFPKLYWEVRAKICSFRADTIKVVASLIQLDLIECNKQIDRPIGFKPIPESIKKD